MAEPSVYTVVRAILNEHFKWSTDEVMARAKAQGVTRADGDIRKVVNKTRSEIRERQKRKGRGAAGPSVYTLAREMLTADPALPSDEALTRLKERGVTRSDTNIREVIRNVRYDVQRKGAKAVPAAARVTSEPKPVALNEESVFAAITKANKIAHQCGGVAKARDIAEAIRGCGGIDAFLKHLDVVGEILASDTEM